MKGRVQGSGFRVQDWRRCVIALCAGWLLVSGSVSAQNSSIIRGPLGGAGLATAQTATSTTRSVLVQSRAARRSVAILNLDSAITIYLGGATVTSANGLPIGPGQSISIDCRGKIYVVAASGTPSVAYLETYD